MHFHTSTVFLCISNEVILESGLSEPRMEPLRIIKGSVLCSHLTFCSVPQVGSNVSWPLLLLCHCLTSSPCLSVKSHLPAVTQVKIHTLGGNFKGALLINEHCCTTRRLPHGGATITLSSSLCRCLPVLSWVGAV